ncbi:hypothetical protein PENTCL1PPCAC_16653, partial [Pristionchus entomophagus]
QPIFSLDVKWNLVNITNLQPMDRENFEWNLQAKCTNCPDEEGFSLEVNMSEEKEAPGSGKYAHFMKKCKLCWRVNTITIVKDFVAPYTIYGNERFQPVLKIDCNGIEPYEFHLRGLWKGVGPNSNTQFENIDLNEEWTDYDEKIQEAVEINSFDYRFTHANKK